MLKKLIVVGGLASISMASTAQGSWLQNDTFGDFDNFGSIDFYPITMRDFTNSVDQIIIYGTVIRRGGQLSSIA